MKKICIHSGAGEFHNRWVKHITELGAEAHRINLLGNNALQLVEHLDGVMWHLSMKPSLLQAASPVLNPVEFVMKKKVFPNWYSRWHFENKIAQKYLFKGMKVNTPATFCF